MPVHPDLEGFLELAEMGRLTGKNLPMHQMSVAAAREEFECSSAIVDPCPPGELEVSRLQFSARDGVVLQARLYRKPGTRGQATLLYFHGGGYVIGSLDSHDSVCRRLALHSDFAVLAPAYRRAPEQPFPCALNDCLDAANWLAEQAFSLDLDPHKVAFAGDSVGATLATVLAISAVKTPQLLALKPLAQLLFYPVTDTSRERESHRLFAEGYLLESQTLEWFYQAYATPAQRRDWRVSPLLFEGDLRLAPAFIALAGYDPLRDEGLEYARRLQASGTQVKLEVLEGLTHDFLRMTGLVPEMEGVYLRALGWLEGVA